MMLLQVLKVIFKQTPVTFQGNSQTSVSDLVCNSVHSRFKTGQNYDYTSIMHCVVNSGHSTE